MDTCVGKISRSRTSVVDSLKRNSAEDTPIAPTGSNHRSNTKCGTHFPVTPYTAHHPVEWNAWLRSTFSNSQLHKAREEVIKTLNACPQTMLTIPWNRENSTQQQSAHGCFFRCACLEVYRFLTFWRSDGDNIPPRLVHTLISAHTDMK